MNHIKDRVIRIQGDKLCEELGYPKGTKIDIRLIKEIANAKYGDFIVVDGKSIDVNPKMIAVSQVLLEKIEG